MQLQVVTASNNLLEQSKNTKKKGTKEQPKKKAQKKPREITRLNHPIPKCYILTNFRTFSNCSCLEILELSNSNASSAFKSGESSRCVSM